MKALLILCCSCMLFLSGCNMAPTEKLAASPEDNETQFHGEIISTFNTQQFSRWGMVTVTVWKDSEGRLFQTTTFVQSHGASVFVLQLK